MKNKILSLFISLCLLVLLPTRVAQADNGRLDDNSGETNISITFTPNPDTGGSGEPEEPENPEVPEEPGDNGNNPLEPEIPGNNETHPPIQENHTGGSIAGGMLPQTNEQQLMYLVPIGLILIGLSLIIYLDRKRNERSKFDHEN